MFGAPVRRHSARLLGDVIGVVCSAGFAIALWTAVAKFAGAPRAVIGLAIAFSALAVFLGWSLWRASSLRIVAYEQGLGWTRLGKTTQLRFDEIADVRAVGAKIVIRRHSGGPLELTSKVTELEQLLAHLRRGASTPSAPSA